MNTAQPEIRIYTCKELRAWLNDNQSTDRLSESVITPTRAYAIVHNPWLKDDDPVVAALYIGKELAAFTASFPDQIDGKTYHWFSTLWCSPKHQGKGYGLLVVGSLCETYGTELCLDMWGAPETVGIFQYLGHQTTTFPEYRFEPKHIKKDTIKGKLAYIANRIHRISVGKKPLNPYTQHPYTIKYVSHIDSDTYNFINNHSASDLMPRSRETLNWILAYHFVHRSPLTECEPQSNQFDDRDSRYWMSGVQAFINGILSGFYILRNADSDLSVKYLYFDPKSRDCIFHSIAQHIVALGNPKFSTRNPQLAQYIASFNWFDRERIDNISFSYPKEFAIPPSAISQGGDGDGFV